jgi:hypothetical protein
MNAVKSDKCVIGVLLTVSFLPFSDEKGFLKGLFLGGDGGNEICWNYQLFITIPYHRIQFSA